MEKTNNRFLENMAPGGKHPQDWQQLYIGGWFYGK
jgi:hypothetical protein